MPSLPAWATHQSGLFGGQTSLRVRELTFAAAPPRTECTPCLPALLPGWPYSGEADGGSTIFGSAVLPSVAAAFFASSFLSTINCERSLSTGSTVQVETR